MRRMSPFVSFVSLLLVGSPAVTAAEVDPGFGSSGVVRLGFQAVSPGSDAARDRAIIGCVGTHGALTVTGLASGGRRIVTAWLDEQGALDTRFSSDGKESYTLHAGELEIDTGVGRCLPNGDLLIAYTASTPNVSTNADIHVRRIDADTGLPDPSFGVAGLQVLDLDAFATGTLGEDALPLAINAGSDGDILISGSYRSEPIPPVGEDESPFVARLRDDGTVLAVLLLHEEDAALRRAVGTVPGPGGLLWSVVQRMAYDAPSTFDVLRLDPATLSPSGSRLRAFGDDFIPDQAIDSGDGSIVVSGHSNLHRAPVVAQIDADRATSLLLPSPAGLPDVRKVRAAMLPGGDLIVAGNTYNNDIGQSTSLYLARVESRADRSLSLAPNFGRGGSTLLSASGGPACNGLLAPQNAYGLTLWNGRPTLIGDINVACLISVEGDVDYLLLRLREPAFRDGFE